MDKFQKRHTLLNQMQEEIENLNRPIVSNVFELVKKKLSQEKHRPT